MPKVNRSGKAKILSDAELSKIRKALNTPSQRLLFDILRYTGERVGAVVQLQRLDVYEPNGKPREYITFRAQTRKAAPGGKRRTRQLVIYPTLAESLAEFTPAADSPWLFPARSDPYFHITRQGVDDFIRRACDRAGLGGRGISLHSFRRTLITRLHEKGVGVGTIKAITGHASLRSVQEYIDVSEEQVKNALNQL